MSIYNLENLLQRKIDVALGKLNSKTFYQILGKVNHDPNVANSSHMYQVHKDASSISFFIKDLLKHLNLKMSNGVYMFIAKSDLVKRKKLLRRIISLKSYFCRPLSF